MGPRWGPFSSVRDIAVFDLGGGTAVRLPRDCTYSLRHGEVSHVPADTAGLPDALLALPGVRDVLYLAGRYRPILGQPARRGMAALGPRLGRVRSDPGAFVVDRCSALEAAELELRERLVVRNTYLTAGFPVRHSRRTIHVDGECTNGERVVPRARGCMACSLVASFFAKAFETQLVGNDNSRIVTGGADCGGAFCPKSRARGL